MKTFNRRNFLKAGFLSSAVIITSGCDVFAVSTMNDTLKVLQYDIFPQAKELKIDTTSYISIILHHSRVEKSEKIFLKNGIKWLNETAVTMYKSTYYKLPKEKRETVITAILETQWGESWLDTLMRYTMEAAFGDPIYGGNNKEAGWKWLAFEGGKPRATRMFL